MQTSSAHRIDIPESLRQQLVAFRRRVWTIKLIEAVGGACVGILLGYLATFVLDRFFDTPAPLRGLIFTLAFLTCAMIPWALDRWVWRRRRLDQLARLLSVEHPSIGDQLLGVIELAESDSEQTRSPVLVAAAIRRVAEQAEQRDFRNAVPHPRHRRNAGTAIVLGVLAIGMFAATTAAASNAWKRYLAPWSATPRYTYAAVEALPAQIVVPHGEEFQVPIRLTTQTEWKPEQAEVRLQGLAPVQSPLQEEQYRFSLPGQIQPGLLDVRVGDFQGQTKIEPMLRPELVQLTAEITLPAYLQRTAALTKEIRGGAIAAVHGSSACFKAEISRTLASAKVNEQQVSPRGTDILTSPHSVNSSTKLELSWLDEHGLSGQQPYEIHVTAVADEAPSLVCENLPRKQIVLDSEVIPFQIKARDDFGVKRVGMEWKGIDPGLVSPARGEKIIGAGNSEAELLALAATFSAQQLGIAPQPIELRVFVEDYLPGRERVYSPASTLFVLDPEQHAIWVTSQLSRWHRMALDIRDRELQLHETNKELRALDPVQLDQPEVRLRIEAQAAAERTNGQRLTGLVASGEDLLKQAMRNPEIGVGHLDRWAEMMQLLKDISGNRMPSVADLLNDAAKSPALAQNSPTNRNKTAGENRANVAGADSKTGKEQKKTPTAIPTITDVESTRNEMKPGEPKEPTEAKPKSPRLTLPTTMLAGNGESKKKPATPAGEKVDDAVREQQDLLAEFEKIADELNEVLANLEGSTLVKRLKASSRKQEQVAQKLSSHVSSVFGVSVSAKSTPAESLQQLAKGEAESSQVVSYIMDDMAAYFDRNRLMRFKVVLDEMQETDVVGSLRQLSDDLPKENGLTISQAEYWSENLDRWAENLVEATNCGACPGCKSKGSLPPSIVLEVLQILESEIHLREQTRVVEQARSAVDKAEFTADAEKLSKAQAVLGERIEKVIVRILELPDAKAEFGKELNLLQQVSQVMSEATQILQTPETGSQAIAAETEAIELLLQSKRFNPNGGGGGGSTPGGGGGGETETPALALVGAGVNAKEVREDQGTAQATGQAGVVLPEEFRAGLDEYFNRIDQP